MQKYCQKEPKLNGVYSKQNYLNKEAYIINIDECKSIGTHQRDLYVNDNNLANCESFEVEYIQKEI